ncbi:helix-turn-helix domain-containing protein [Rhodovulum imhoffii]|nr:helix-turn-helix domain-containing protein [Rhodovulum imhoffii]
MRGERATLGKSLLDVQRELKIKAAYIAAIENLDVSAFETPGFIAGYVRSYARYLGLDPDLTYRRFCEEGGLPRPCDSAPKTERRTTGDPLTDPNALFVPQGDSFLSRVEPGAIGSVLVLILLLSGLAYGGWSVFKQIQRVQLSPVEQTPGVVVQVDPLTSEHGVAQADIAPPSPDAMTRLYRPQALEAPVLVARDGPIAALKPDRVGAFADRAADPHPPVFAESGGVAAPEESQVRVLAGGVPEVSVLAVRPAWIRVSAADGAVLFEKILDAGERYVVPQTEQPPVLRAGNSGAVYFSVGEKTYGPALPGARVAKNVSLGAGDLVAAYDLADPDADPALASAIAVAQAQGGTGSQ